MYLFLPFWTGRERDKRERRIFPKSFFFFVCLFLFVFVVEVLRCCFVLLFCCSSVILFCCFVLLLLCSIILFCCCFVLLLFCSSVALFCYFVLLLLCSVILFRCCFVLLLCSSVILFCYFVLCFVHLFCVGHERRRRISGCSSGRVCVVPFVHVCSTPRLSVIKMYFVIFSFCSFVLLFYFFFVLLLLFFTWPYDFTLFFCFMFLRFFF